MNGAYLWTLTEDGKTFVAEASEIEHASAGRTILLPDGSIASWDDFKANKSDGEILDWSYESNGKSFVILND